MFISKLRPIAISQAEHQKLAGTLALLWGNAAFERPPIARESFVKGVGLHDRAYGALDNLPIGGIPEHEWLELTRRGFAQAWADPAAELIAKLHLQRLAGYGGSPERQAAAAELTQAAEAHAREHSLDPALFARIDRITNLCDLIAFDFCFEAPAEGAVSVFPRNNGDEQMRVRYRVAGGTIEVDPWPFAGDSHAGYLVGYQLAGYPDRLEPVVAEYTLKRLAQ